MLSVHDPLKGKEQHVIKASPERSISVFVIGDKGFGTLNPSISQVYAFSLWPRAARNG